MSITLTFSILGQKIATVNLDLTEHASPTPQPLVDRGIKKITKAWTKRMAS